MVLVILKNTIFGAADDKQALLPTARAYETGIESDDDEDDLEEKSVVTSTLEPSTSSHDLINPRVMSDIIIGLSDGLTVPFALTAGLSSLGNSRLVITGGLAELVSGAISMGLGGFLAAKSEHEYYDNQVEKETLMLQTTPTVDSAKVENILKEYHISQETTQMFIRDLEKVPSSMIEFIISVGNGLEKPADGRQFTSAATIGISYFLGGFLPLLPYFFTDSVEKGLIISVAVMAVTLFTFGVCKTILSLGRDCAPSKVVINGFQMLLTGGVAAGAAWALVKVIQD